MPRISNQQYYDRYRFLRNIWLHYQYVYAVLPIDQQQLVHDFYQPSKVLSLEELLGHMDRAKRQRPSLPNAASKAAVRLYQAVKQAVKESGDNELRFRDIISQQVPKPRYQRKPTRNQRLAAVVRPEPDFKLLSQALIKLHQELARELEPLLPKPQSLRTITATMQDLSDEERREVLGEVLLDEFKAIREGISNLPTMQQFNALQNDVTELKGDMQVVKAAVTDQSKQLAGYEHRLADLENAA